MAGPGTFVTLPTALQEAIQQGYIEREFRDGLQSKTAYTREAVPEPVLTGVGETVDKSRIGRLAPTTTPVTPTSVNGDINNGLTPVTLTQEMFRLTLNQYMGTADINLMMAKAGLKNYALKLAQRVGEMGIYSKERIGRNALFNAYMSGNSRVNTALGAGSTTTCFVDDVRGFETVMVYGKMVAVSGSNPLSVVETGSVSQTLSVTGVTRDGTNRSTAAVANGWSGFLTFTTATLPVTGDVLTAANAPTILRAGSRSNTAALTSSDLLTLALVRNGVNYLRDQGTPPHDDGLFHCALDNTSGGQLFGDTEFQSIYRGLAQSQQLQQGYVDDLMGVRFIFTNEAPVQAIAGQVNVKVRRPLIMGAEALIEGAFQGTEEFVNEMTNGLVEMIVVDGVVLAIRPPIDRAGQVGSYTWIWVGDFACGSDVTANTNIVPTANGPAQFKRSICLEHAG